MDPRIVAAIFAVAALPVAAQTTPRAERPATQEARVQPDKPGPDARAGTRERAKAVRERNRQDRKAARQKQDRTKKAPAG